MKHIHKNGKLLVILVDKEVASHGFDEQSDDWFESILSI